MCQPADRVLPPTEYPALLARADALEQEIVDLCARINAANYRLLQLIVELDKTEPWGAWGLTSCAHWLNWRCGIGLNAAREKVRVAHALVDLPAVSAAFADGRLSFSKVRAVTRIANSGNEAELLELALNATAAQVESLVRARRRVDRLAERDLAMGNYVARELNYYYDDDGSLIIRARLPAEEGSLVVKALEAALDAQQREVGTEEVTAVTRDEEDVTAVTSVDENRFAQRRADALLEIAETALRHGPEASFSAERYQVVVQVSAATLANGETGRAELDNGPRIAPDTARRLACDASLLRVTADAVGNPLDIGRKTRAVPPAMQRALRARDGGCRFPGCTRQRRVDAHHIRHWANGGETSLANLVLLCRHHHRLVHEGGFGVERDADSVIRFTRPDGSAIADQPQLPPGGNFDGSIESVDAADWTLPEGTMDLDLAISGLLQAEASAVRHRYSEIS